ncbi:MAG: RNA polymerase Rpb4 family protein [Nitrososphaerota archaeon]|nr:RNA polymerase Rpb4 family protein [Candidatus Bathyarchaeota archaeon]MDW8048722.1 RNA polymerase Rpb4 family protein [Nitrososphaerota archaeon]
MARRLIKTQPISIPQVKKILQSIGEENLDQFQRRSLDYAIKFSKIDAASAESLLEELKKEALMEEEEAIQIINCMPKSIEELRVFLAGGRKIIETSKLELILNLLDKYRSKGEDQS